jgi:hypothetical protein
MLVTIGDLVTPRAARLAGVRSEHRRSWHTTMPTSALLVDGGAAGSATCRPATRHLLDALIGPTGCLPIRAMPQRRHTALGTPDLATPTVDLRWVW